MGNQFNKVLSNQLNAAGFSLTIWLASDKAMSKDFQIDKGIYLYLSGSGQH